MNSKKTILLTGAGSGIGKATAFSLAKRGHHVIATTETEAQAEALELECASGKINLDILKLDICLAADRDKISKLELDVLINNAAIGESGSLAEIDLDKVRRNFEVNVFSTFEISQIALKNMIAKNSGTVVFISSLAGRIVIPFLAPYCMTKFALSSGVEALRSELRKIKSGVNISLIEPGAYHTGFNQLNIGKKYDWIDDSSYFHGIKDKIKKKEDWQFAMTEAKTTDSIVKKIVKATEARKPRLRYSAPWWQAAGTQVLRIFGK